MKKIKVGILGATGMVGQRYISLLQNHPLFEVNFLAASPDSAGKKWGNLTLQKVTDIEQAKNNCRLVFSAFNLPEKNLIKKIEIEYARAGIVVCSNTSAHRGTANVPMLIPEINSEHLKIIPSQKRFFGFKKGFIITKPNCSLQSYLLPIFALQQSGYTVKQIMLTTMQAVSGAGYPGIPSLDILDNIIPFISGEEEKTENESLKILGKIKNKKIVDNNKLKISAQCTRVPVSDGHLACVSILFAKKIPGQEKIIEIWKNFRSLPQRLHLPSAPQQPIIFCEENDRPQPKKDRMNEGGMAITVGRLRKCNVLDYKFVALSHNIIRGAAGGNILNAELLYKCGLLS